MKTEKNKNAELVRAAQFAGADEQSQEFWRQVAAHAGAKEVSRGKLVTPRNLTDAPKMGTV